ncbi:MAG: hypothetical protein KBT02_05810 [Treponema sp.]|nr:hypothetical protein [Candidatus Treponema caballi]
MASNEEAGTVTGVEREIVLEVLKSQSTVVIIQAPELSFVVQPSGYTVPAEGLLFFSERTLLAIPSGGECAVCFFYHGRGMFFKSIMRHTKNGTACVIPAELYKQPDSSPERGSQVMMRMYLTDRGPQKFYTDCYQSPDFPLFKNNLWTCFSKDDVAASAPYLKNLADLVPAKLPVTVHKLVSKERKILYLPDGSLPTKNYFPYDATITANDAEFYRDINPSSFASLEDSVYIPLSDTLDASEKATAIMAFKSDDVSVSPLDITEVLAMLPVCRFLGKDKVVPQAVQGRVQPLTLLFINDYYVVVGMSAKNQPFKKGEEYKADIVVSLPVGSRIITVTLALARIFMSESGNNACALMRYVEFEEEDRRFIFEKYYGSRYI